MGTIARNILKKAHNLGQRPEIKDEVDSAEMKLKEAEEKESEEEEKEEEESEKKDDEEDKEEAISGSAFKIGRKAGKKKK